MADKRPQSPFERDLAERLRADPAFRKEFLADRAEHLRRNWRIPGALWLPLRCDCDR